jgi:hypothetical protein
MSHSNDTNSIPFLDLVTPHVEMEQELTAIFHKVLHTAVCHVLWHEPRDRH